MEDRSLVRLLGRPTHLSAGLGFTGIHLLFSPSTPSSLNGTQPKSATCSEVSAIWKRVSKMWGIGGLKTTFFDDFAS